MIQAGAGQTQGGIASSRSALSKPRTDPIPPFGYFNDADLSAARGDARPPELAASSYRATRSQQGRP